MPRRLTLLLLLSVVALLAAAGGAASAPRLDFAYDPKAPLAYVDRGTVVGTHGTVHDVSFRSQGRTVQGYLVLPSGSGRHGAVVVVHGSALGKIPAAYKRYLEHFLADTFKLRGTPLRIQFKAGVNPYADTAARR